MSVLEVTLQEEGNLDKDGRQIRIQSAGKISVAVLVATGLDGFKKGDGTRSWRRGSRHRGW